MMKIQEERRINEKHNKIHGVNSIIWSNKLCFLKENIKKMKKKKKALPFNDDNMQLFF